MPKYLFYLSPSFPWIRHFTFSLLAFWRQKATFSSRQVIGGGILPLPALFILQWTLFIEKASAQSSPSFQAKFITPSLLSACNRDTICVDVSNLQGSKGVTYTGNATLAVDTVEL